MDKIIMHETHQDLCVCVCDKTTTTIHHVLGTKQFSERERIETVLNNTISAAIVFDKCAWYRELKMYFQARQKMQHTHSQVLNLLATLFLILAIVIFGFYIICFSCNRVAYRFEPSFFAEKKWQKFPWAFGRFVCFDVVTCVLCSIVKKWIVIECRQRKHTMT